MATRARREPKSQVIAADLRGRIHDGQYPPGSSLPPQRELSASYGVTLATLRQALAVLQSDGLVSQQAGRGTFVTEPRAAYRPGSLRGFAEDLQAQGHLVGTEVLGQALRRPPRAVAEALAVPGIALGRAVEAMHPGLLDRPTASLLRQSPGAAAFISDRVTFDLDGIPVVVDRAVILGTAMEIRTEQTGGEMSVRWSRHDPEPSSPGQKPGEAS